MFTRRRLLTAFAATAALGVAGAGRRASAGERGPVVVELFTSQGCSSCPAADRFLAELAGRGDVIALSFHVDYWNYMGWADPFSRPEYSARQRHYKKAMGLRYVYTPQIVVDGAAEAVGTEQATVERLIREAADRPRLVRPKLAADGMTVTVDLTARPDAPPAVVCLAVFDRLHATDVARGENAGRKAVNAHVVRAMPVIGEWAGEATRLTYTTDALTRERGCAVIVQARGNGPILGAAMIRPPMS
ncbi:MAG: DUF1223 domain-containing protein [Alphaproteobacteria bacterium]